MKKRNYWDILTKDIFQNRLLMFFAVLTTVLCFGFTITNFSIGVDDPARDYYLYSSNTNSMIQQGRLLHVAFNLVTRSVQFIPFFTDFVGAFLYALSALMFCALFQYISDDKFSIPALISFACVYISSSVIVEKYIYHLDVIVTIMSYCFSALALLYAYRFIQEKTLLLFCKAVVTLMGAIASYESFIFLYFCGVFAIIILDIAVNQDNKTLLTILLEGIRYAAILCAAVAIYYGLVYLVQIVTGQYGITQRYNAWEATGLGFVENFVVFTKDFILFFWESIRSRYLPILVFCFFSIVGAGLFILLAWRYRNIWLFLCYCALWVGNFPIHYAAGTFMTRAAQTFCFFTGFVVMFLVHLIQKPAAFKRILLCLVTLLVFVQSADMNRWFYNDYVRYKKETYVIDTIATKLLGEHDVSKPTVFIGHSHEGYLSTTLYPGRQVNGNPVVYWSAIAYANKTQPFVSELFRMHGYDFILSPTEEEYDLAHAVAETMPIWPQPGSIQETDDVIVVNFG